ncbi:hypothetical protein SAMN05216338_10358 [Bradyrhizobium sp. Rc2d]|nr:hypothetical protein SAMN05216338_10358 [Bradyrhizobium sp. Rc2d]
MEASVGSSVTATELRNTLMKNNPALVAANQKLDRILGRERNTRDGRKRLNDGTTPTFFAFLTTSRSEVELALPSALQVITGSLVLHTQEHQNVALAVVVVGAGRLDPGGSRDEQKRATPGRRLARASLVGGLAEEDGRAALFARSRRCAKGPTSYCRTVPHLLWSGWIGRIHSVQLPDKSWLPGTLHMDLLKLPTSASHHI